MRAAQRERQGSTLVNHTPPQRERREIYLKKRGGASASRSRSRSRSSYSRSSRSSYYSDSYTKRPALPRAHSPPPVMLYTLYFMLYTPKRCTLYSWQVGELSYFMLYTLRSWQAGELIGEHIMYFQRSKVSAAMQRTMRPAMM